MNFVYYFLSLEENDEKKYIEAIIEEIFEEEELWKCFLLRMIM